MKADDKLRAATSTNTHRDRLERVVCGALQSAIDAHGPITSALIGSAMKRIVGQLYVEGKTRIAVPVVTDEQLRRIEVVADRVDSVQEAVYDALCQLSCDLAVLRDDNHPEGWSEVEFVERADVPVAIIHHHRLTKQKKQYVRKRDGKKVDLQTPATKPDAVDPQVRTSND